MKLEIEITDEMIQEAERAFKSLTSEIKNVDGKKLLEYMIKDCTTNINYFIHQMYESNISDMIEQEVNGHNELTNMGVELKPTLDTLFQEELFIESDEQGEEEDKKFYGLEALIEERDVELYQLQDDKMYLVVTAGDEDIRYTTKDLVLKQDVSNFVKSVQKIIDGE